MIFMDMATWKLYETYLRRDKGGMIIAATHDVQEGTPIKNIIDMYHSIGSYVHDMCIEILNHIRGN